MRISDWSSDVCSSDLLRLLGLDIPIYPVKGYSITVPIADEGRAPVSTLLDESYKIAITRLGDRIRVGGMAELSGFDRTLSERREATLRSEEHTSELQSLMRISYAVFCLKKKTHQNYNYKYIQTK